MQAMRSVFRKLHRLHLNLPEPSIHLEKSLSPCENIDSSSPVMSMNWASPSFLLRFVSVSTEIKAH